MNIQMHFDTNEERLAFIASIIDVVDDFLMERGVTLPESEKEKAENNAWDSNTTFYGTDWSELEDNYKRNAERESPRFQPWDESSRILFSTKINNLLCTLK